MKLSDRARKQGISYRTAWRWFKEGKLPVEAKKTPTGTIQSGRAVLRYTKRPTTQGRYLKI